ncbi:MAG: MFS transporter [Solirubrobacterales bacterium]
MPSPNLKTPLRRPLFRRLAISYAINELGDWMGIIALSVLVYDQTGSALATAALFIGTGFLPALAAPVLVARVEVPSPRFALPALYCLEAAAFCGLALLAVNFSLLGVVVLATIDGALMLAARSLTRAVCATLLAPTGELRAGNAVLNIAFTGGAAVGPAIAGVAVASLGVPAALLIDAVSFLAIALILFLARSMPHADPEPGQLRERVRAGVAYIRDKRVLLGLLIAQGGAMVFFSAVLPIEVIYAKETLGAGDSGYGLLLGAWGVGMVLGSIVFAAARGARLSYLLFFSTVTVGAGYLGLAAAPTLALACVASAVGGAGNGVQWVAVVSAVQELTTVGMQARVVSVLESVAAAAPGVGFVIGGLSAAAIGPRATFLIAGLGVLLIVALATPALARKWPKLKGLTGSADADSRNEIVLELIPGRAAVQSSNPEVQR